MQTQQRFYTPEEYLALEEQADFRSEYRDGEIVPMTGGSINHNRIAGNIYAFLKYALRSKNQEAFISDLRLWIPRYRLYTYPDVFVIAGEPIFQGSRTDTVMNPCLIVEILSKSTQDYDRTDKFRYYRSIPDMQEYLLIEQYAIGVEHYARLEDGSWRFREYDAETSAITLASVGLELTMNDLYEGVIFEQQEAESAVKE
jgi:Uma2 family endonuclease